MPRATIPNKALKLTLFGLRLPINTLEGLSGQRGNESWPPAVAYEEFEGFIKQLVGSILRDEELVEEGRIQQAKVAELRRAVDLDVQAEQARSMAAAELRAEREQADEQRRGARERARQKNAEIDRKRRADEERAAQRLDREAGLADRASQARDKRVAATDRRARLTRANEEVTALEQERSALEATRAAAQAAEELEEQKAERKAN